MKKVRENEPYLFDAFWQQWRKIARHTDGRGLARETFRKHVLNGVEPQDIIDGCAWFIRNLSERDREYVPLSSTWLNRGSFEDACDKERAFKERQSAQPTNVVPLSQPTGQTAFLKAYNSRTAS